MLRCLDAVHGDHVELGAASAPTPAESMASVKGGACENLPNETEKDEYSLKMYIIVNLVNTMHVMSPTFC